MNQTTKTPPITIERERFLTHIYLSFSHVNAWLYKFAKLFGLTQSEEEYLVNLDLWMMPAKALHHAFFDKIKRDVLWGTLDCTSDEERIYALSLGIAKAYTDYDESIKRDEPVINRVMMLYTRDVKNMEKCRKRLLASIYHQDMAEDSRLQDHEIFKAREYPLEKLVELDKNKFILCPFHKDKKPSFYVANGFGYCFSCLEWCDSIRWLMDIEGMGFVGAVRELNRRA